MLELEVASQIIKAHSAEKLWLSVILIIHEHSSAINGDKKWSIMNKRRESPLPDAILKTISYCYLGMSWADLMCLLLLTLLRNTYFF